MSGNNGHSNGAKHQDNSRPWLEEYKWKPGESGNPKGRPKGTALTDRLRKILEADECKVAQEIVDAGVKAAREGDFRFWNAIFERIDGKVMDELKHDGTLDVVVRYVDKPIHHGDSDD